MKLSRIIRTITLWFLVVKILSRLNKFAWSTKLKKLVTIAIILIALVYNYQVIFDGMRRAAAAVYANMPYVFQPGTSILSADMNANFQRIINNALGALSIDTGQLADSVITEVKITDLAVTTAKINTDAVTAAKLDGSCAGTSLDQDGSGALGIGAAADITTTGKITAGTFKLPSVPDVTDYVLKSDADGDASWGQLGTLSLEDDSVTPAKMADGDHGAFTYASNVATIDSGTAISGESPLLHFNETTTPNYFRIGATSGLGDDGTFFVDKCTDADGEYTPRTRHYIVGGDDTSGDRDNPLWGYRGTTLPTGVTYSSVGDWEDFDCDTYYDGTIPSGEVLGIFQAYTYTTGMYIKPYGTNWAATISAPHVGAGGVGLLLVRTNADHIVQLYSASNGAKVYFLGYIPATLQ